MLNSNKVGGEGVGFMSKIVALVGGLVELTFHAWIVFFFTIWDLRPIMAMPKTMELFAAQVAMSIISFYLGVFQAVMSLAFEEYGYWMILVGIAATIVSFWTILHLCRNICHHSLFSHLHHGGSFINFSFTLSLEPGFWRFSLGNQAKRAAHSCKVACTTPSTCSGYQLSRYILHALCY